MEYLQTTGHTTLRVKKQTWRERNIQYLLAMIFVYLDSFYMKHVNTCPKSQETARIDVATHAGAPLQYHNNIVNDGICWNIERYTKISSMFHLFHFYCFMSQ